MQVGKNEPKPDFCRGFQRIWIVANRPEGTAKIPWNNGGVPEIKFYMIFRGRIIRTLNGFINDGLSDDKGNIVDFRSDVISITTNRCINP